MKILFMDDAPSRHEIFQKVCKEKHDATFTAAETIEKLSQGRYDIVYLDHDLNGEKRVERVKDTGTEVAQFIAKLPTDDKPSLVVVHSKFDWGSKRMIKILENAMVNVVRHRIDDPDFGNEFERSH